MKPEHFENVLDILRFGHLQNLVRYQIDIHHAHDAPLLVHDRQREKLVEHKELACVKNRRRLGNRDDPLDHEFRDALGGGGGEQPPGRHNAHEPPIFVGHIEVEDFLAEIGFAEIFNRLVDRPILAQQREVVPRVLHYRFLEPPLLGSVHAEKRNILHGMGIPCRMFDGLLLVATALSDARRS